MKKLLLKNIRYYFSILSKSKINVRVYLLASVIVGLLIPLANVMYPKIIISVFINGLSLFSGILTPAIQALFVIIIFFILTTLAQVIKTYIDRKINWFAPYLQFKLREGIQLRAMMMDFSKTEDKDTLNKYSSAENATSRGEKIFGNISGILSSFILIIIYGILVLRLHPAFLLLMAVNAGIG